MRLSLKIITFIVLIYFLIQTCIVPVGLQLGQTKIVKLDVGTFQGSFSVHGRGKYAATIYYPDNFSGKPYPVIVFAHGFSACSDWHRWIGNCLASNGYVALLFTVPDRISTDVMQWVDGIEGGIMYLQKLNSRFTSLRGMMNMSRLGVMGHSMGGMATIIAASRDPRIKAAVSLAAPYMANEYYDDTNLESIKDEMNWNSVLAASQKITIPIQFQVGTLDAFAANNAETYFDCCNSSTKTFITIEGGNHVQYIDDNYILSPAAVKGYLNLLFHENPITFLKLMTYLAPKLPLILPQKTLSGVAVVLEIDQPAEIASQKQQEISSQNFLPFFLTHLI